MKWKNVGAGLVLAAVALAATTHAGLTTIQQPWAPATGDSSELNLTGPSGILERLTTDATLAHFGLNGAVFTRVDDSVDQVWLATMPQQDMTVTTIFARADQTGGYYLDANGNTVFTGKTGMLSEPSGGFFNSAFAYSLGLNVGDSFRFGLRPTWWYQALSKKSSLEADNAPVMGIRDFMVTYKIQQQGMEDAYLIAFEDGTVDFDYNDFVAIVEGVTPIPEPGAALLGLLGCGLAGWAKRRTT